MKLFKRKKEKKQEASTMAASQKQQQRASSKQQQQQQLPPNKAPSSATAPRRPSPETSRLSQQQQQNGMRQHSPPTTSMLAPPLPPEPVTPIGTPVRSSFEAPPPPPPPLPQQQQQQQQQMQESNQASIDLTRNLVKKFIADIWNRGEVDLIPEVCSPSLRFNGNTGFDRVGHDGLARMVATIREALDDYHCEIHSMVVEHNKAFCRLRFTGKHTGNLLGYPPTGRVVGWMGATEFTCQNGKILKVWELGDIKTLEEQLISIDQPMEEDGDEDDRV